MRRTKIVCTIGPASESPDMVRALLKAGMNVARLNASHGTVQQHAERIETLRRLEEEMGRPLGIMLDVQGPKIRTGPLASPEGIELWPGQDFTLTAEPITGTSRRVSVDYPDLPRIIEPGNTIYLDDGSIELRVQSVRGDDVRCEVVVGGTLAPRKGVTLLGIVPDLPTLTDQDRQHIRFGVEAGVDFIAASFVRKAEDVREVREAVAAAGGSQLIIAKIETRMDLDELRRVVQEADAVMVARGDLGVQIPLEEVPSVQKAIIRMCNEYGKPVITATQMLESMVRNPRPTRAEVTDVAAAILDGTDAVMLSAETAVGKYPAKAVEMMHRIAVRTEETIDFDALLSRRSTGPGSSVAEAISYAVCWASHDLSVKAIITSTQSGATARMVSKFRPYAPILAMTPELSVARQLCLVWGVRPILVPQTHNIDDMIDAAVSAAIQAGEVAVGDRVAITAGVKTGIPGSTNLLQIHDVSDPA